MNEHKNLANIQRKEFQVTEIARAKAPGSSEQKCECRTCSQEKEVSQRGVRGHVWMLPRSGPELVGHWRPPPDQSRGVV